MSHPIHAPIAPQKSANQSTPSWTSSWRTQLFHAFPNLIVFSLLAGTLYLGHRTGWKMPALSTIMGSAPSKVDDWCPEHLVAESECIECQIELSPKASSYGFCAEHGVAECVIHHPELAQVLRDPQLPQYDTVHAISLIDRPENNSRNTLHTRRVQFASAEGMEKSGIQVDVVQEHSMMDVIKATGEMKFDPTRVAHLSSRVPGSASFVFKTVGDPIAAGEILAIVDAASVGQAKTNLVQTLLQLQLRKSTEERLRRIAASGAVPQKSVTEAETAMQEAEVAFVTARQALENLGFELPNGIENTEPQAMVDDLRFLGIPPDLLKLLPTDTHTANLIPIRAPSSGMIIESDLVAGEVVDSADTLFTVADPSRLWLWLNVRQEDAKYLRTGLPVHFTTDKSAIEASGPISWISPTMDGPTRTLQVRVNIPNTDGQWRDKTFGTGRIILREEPHAIVVPRAAVHSTTDAHFVFVRDKGFFAENSPKFFHVRQVRMGAQDGQFIELLAGALPGEVIATKGSNVLMAQLLRSNLGAGCGCHEK